MQNIYIGSRNITIQWLSNEDHIIPAKDNPNQDIYAPDFYDKTGTSPLVCQSPICNLIYFLEFETILTSVELDKVLGKSKRMILPEEELARVEKILQRSNDKAEGKLDMSNIELTEDNPDGLDISLYKGEDQLDEIEKRKTDKEKTTKKSSTPGKNKKQLEEKSDKDDVPSKSSHKEETIAEAKKGRGRPKKEASEDKSESSKSDHTKSDNEPTGGKREKRRASKNTNYDHSSYDFLEEDDDEVMPAPKKRKSQDSISEPADSKKEPKKAEKKDEEKETIKKDTEDVKKEELTTSERAILEEQEKAEDTENSTSELKENNESQPVKKRGRKPKAKE